MEIEFGHSVWIGLAATVVMSIALYLLPLVGFPRTDVYYYLGSFFKVPKSRAALYGLMVHLGMGIIFAFLYGLAFLFLEVSPRWWIGSLAGVVHWVAVMLSMDIFSEVNREVKAGRLKGPGLFMSNLGVASAVGSLARHIVFGTAVGLLYDVYASG